MKKISCGFLRHLVLLAATIYVDFRTIIEYANIISNIELTIKRNQ